MKEQLSNNIHFTESEHCSTAFCFCWKKYEYAQLALLQVKVCRCDMRWMHLIIKQSYSQVSPSNMNSNRTLLEYDIHVTIIMYSHTSADNEFRFASGRLLLSQLLTKCL
jgi:hypothetical protein